MLISEVIIMGLGEQTLIWIERVKKSLFDIFFGNFFVGCFHLELAKKNGTKRKNNEKGKE